MQAADIVYFPIDKSGTANQVAAWKILEAFQRSGTPFCIAWGDIPADEQPLLDKIGQKQSTPGGDLESLTSNPIFRGEGQALLRASAGVPQLALGAPAAILLKLRAGEKLGEDERATLPHGYRAPPEGLEDFAEKLETIRGLRERQIARLYRAHLFEVQFAAEKLVSYYRAQAGTKVLAFLRKRDLEGDGIPFFVSQKIEARQLNFERVPPNEQSRLLTRLGVGARFVAVRQVVDRSPIAGRDFR